MNRLGDSHALPVLTRWLGHGAATEARRLFAARKIPSYDTPEQAVQAFGHLHQYRQNQQLLMETPPDVSGLMAFDRGKADAIIDRALEDGRRVLAEPKATGVLAAYGIPTVPSVTAHDMEGACRGAEKLGFPVVLKILSRDISAQVGRRRCAAQSRLTRSARTRRRGYARRHATGCSRGAGRRFRPAADDAAAGRA